jgi:hypothetical protein
MVLPIVAAIFAIVTATIVTTTLPFPINAATAITAASASTATTVSTTYYRWLQPLFMTTTHYRRFLPLRLNFYEYLHRRRNGRFLPSPLATASIRNRHGCRNRTRQDRNPDACRNLSTPFSIDAVKFLPTPFVFYRQHILSPLLSTATVFCRCRNLSTPFLLAPFFTAAVAIDTACYRPRLLSTPLAIDPACYRHRLLPPPFSIAVFTAAVFDRNRYDRNSTGSCTLS